jgi:hypothetical protein
MLGDTDAVGACDFGDSHLRPRGSIQVNVIGADASGKGKPQLLGLGNPLARQIGGPEGLRNDYLGVR